MRSLLGLVIAATVALSAASATAHYTPSGAKCRFVAFAPNSDAGAFDVTARNTTCAAARQLARSVGRDSDSLGWSCRFRPHRTTTDLPHVDYRCTRGTRSVVFVLQ